MGSPVPQKQDVELWSVEHVAAWLQQVSLTDCCEVFLRRGIDGRALLQLTEEGLVLWGRDVSIRNRKHIMKLVSQIKNQQENICANLNSISNNGAITNAIKQKTSSVSIAGANGGFGRSNGGFAPAHSNTVPQRHGLGPPSHRPPPPPPPPDDSFSSDEHDEDNTSQVHSSKEMHAKGEEIDDYTLEPVKNVPSTYPHAPHRVPPNKPPAPPPTTPAAPWLSKPPSNPPPAPPQASAGVVSSKLSGVWPPANAHNKTSEHAKQNGVWNNGIQTKGTANRVHELTANNLSALTRLSAKNSINSGSDDSTQDHHYEIVLDPASAGNNGPPALPPRNQSCGDRVGVGAPTESPPPLPDQPPSLGPSTKGPVPVAAVPPVIVPTAKKSLPALPSNPVDDAPQCLAPPPPIGTNGSISAMPVLVMGDGDTIEMTPLYLQIKDRSYFHPITRKESKSILENVPDGTFLMRPSKRQSNNPLTLCLRYNGKTYNINVRERPDKTFALGMEKPNESTFKSVDEIVSVHKIDYIKLEDGRKVQLLSSPPKYSNILD